MLLTVCLRGVIQASNCLLVYNIRVLTTFSLYHRFNRQIHTLGNTGFFGAVHAAVGALSTNIIDVVAYKGRDVRSEVARELVTRVLENKKDNSTSIRVLDMCCGVGISTRALKTAFDEIENATIIGLDTSPGTFLE